MTLQKKMEQLLEIKKKHDLLKKMIKQILVRHEQDNDFDGIEELKEVMEYIEG